jgi:hypothetical protein
MAAGPGGYRDQGDSGTVTPLDREQAAYLTRACTAFEPAEIESALTEIGDEWLTAADVEEDASELFNQFDYLDRRGMGTPMVRVGDGREVPVSLRALADGRFPSRAFDFRGPRYAYRGEYDDYRYEELAQELLHGVDSRAETPEDQMRLTSPDEARTAFTEAATEFLARRISALRSLRVDLSGPWRSVSFLAASRRSGVRPTKAPGCAFQVITNSSGLRVHWSGSYCRNGKYFGGPTTPAQGVLLSGSYTFGVDGGAYTTIAWDSAVVVLPGQPSVHLNY